MLPASHRTTGGCVAFPDVCLTPRPLPVPVPYTNRGMNAAAVKFALTVLIAGGNALNMASIIGVSQGDEPGVLHRTIMGPCSFLTGFPTVIIEGAPGVMLTATTNQNASNARGAHVVPSATNVMYGFAVPEAPLEGGGGSLGRAALRAISSDEALSGPLREVDHCLLPGRIGYLALRVFSGGAPARVHGALHALAEEGMEHVIIDLRGNPGGEVRAAIELAGDFLARGSVIATLIDEDGDETVYRAHGERPYEVPVILLVDRGTASASELFAGALRAHGRAVILGETTYGKGYARTFAPDSSGGDCEGVTRVVFPDGVELKGEGIRPDIEVPATAAAPALFK